MLTGSHVDDALPTVFQRVETDRFLQVKSLETFPALSSLCK